MKLFKFNILALFVAGTMGCSTTLKVTYYPEFFSSDISYQSIAVASVQNVVDPGAYTKDLNKKIIKDLNKAEFYLVKDYTNTKMTDNEMLSYLYETGTADLALFSTLTDYGEWYDQHTETRQESEDIYAVDEDGYTQMDEFDNPVVDHTEYYDVDYTVYERTSYASLKVQLIEVQTGRSLMDTYKSGQCSSESEDSDLWSPSASERWCAIEDAMDTEVYQITPTKENIKIDEDEVMVLYHHKSEYRDKGKNFPIDDTLRVVLSFPKKALYNTFTYDIVYGSDDTIVFEDSIYWDGNTYFRDYPIRELVEISDGAQKFEIRLWNDGKVAFSKTIKIK